MPKTYLKEIKLKLKINVNDIDKGGYPLNCVSGKQCNYVGVLVFDDNGKAISTTAGLYFPEQGEFIPGKTYVSNIYLALAPKDYSNMAVGNIIELRVGIQHNNANWAKGEILEISENH